MRCGCILDNILALSPIYPKLFYNNPINIPNDKIIGEYGNLC